MQCDIILDFYFPSWNGMTNWKIGALLQYFNITIYTGRKCFIPLKLLTSWEKEIPWQHVQKKLHFISLEPKKWSTHSLETD